MPQRLTKILIVLAILLLILPVLAAVPAGRITVYSTPQGAQVCIDRKDCDSTPWTFVVEGNAWHMIVVTEKGYRDWTETIYVTSGQTSSVNAYLDQDPAATAVRVNVVPGGGTVCLDNSQCRNDVGTINSTGSTLFTGVTPGYHTISVESPSGYVDTQKLVQVTLGKTTNVTLTLAEVIPTPTTPKPVKPATGMVRVYVDRTGSTICIDNARCVYNVGGSPGPGTGTTFFDDVTVNETHIVTVAADGFEPFSVPVSVGKDLIENVDVVLQPIAGSTPLPTTAPTPTVTLATTVQVTPLQTTIVPTTLVTVAPIQTRSDLDPCLLIGALAISGGVILSRKKRS